MEKKTQLVLIINTVTMVVEVVAGYLTQSLALTADGWHMSSHVAAFVLSIFAFRFARHPFFKDRLMAGSEKVFSLAGFVSGLMLIGISIQIFAESIHRFMNLTPVEYDSALVVALVGLGVNIWSAKLLHHKPEDSNHNIRSAYIHVLADALTSVLAVVALLFGKYGYALWLDPVMGILGGIVIFVWCLQLLKSCAFSLMDIVPKNLDQKILREKLDAHGIESLKNILILRNPLKKDSYHALCILKTDQSKTLSAKEITHLSKSLGLEKIWFVL